MSTRHATTDVKLEPPTNPAHRRQRLWQILVPLGISVIIFLALAVLVSLGTARNVTFGRQWADVSAVYLILFYFVIGLVLLVILGLGIFILTKLLNVVPVFFLRVMTIFFRIEGTAFKISNSAAKPVLGIRSAWAGFLALLRDLGLRKQAG